MVDTNITKVIIMNNLNIKDPVCGMNVSKTSKFSKINDKKEYYKAYPHTNSQK